MLRSLHFDCPERHQWEVELTDSLEEETSVSSICPVCGAPGQSRTTECSAMEAPFTGELPPPPLARAGGMATMEGAAGALRSNGPAREGLARDPPPIAGYRILGELGRGGMGVVYRAEQVSLGREVALKIVLAGAHAGWSERSRFRVEAETAARLKHPNIVSIYEVGEQDDVPYLALEFVDGGSLAQALAKSPLAPGEAALLAETLARAMEHVHRHGIVHRDLKPANVLLTAEGVPKIADFGLAKWLDVPSGHSQSGAILGTPNYMAPEQARGEAKLTGPATDVYALGAILYEMVAGRPPFRAATPQQTVQQLLTEDPLPPSRLQPQLSRDLETVCLKCLQKEPSRRYASAGALADDLRRFLDGKPIQARPTPSWERVVKWTRRRPGTAAVLAVSALATVALVASTLAYNARLLRERASADAGRDAARTAQRQAEADFRLALDAVKRFYTEVSENKLLNVPTLDPLRIELLERARDFYQRIAQERPDDPDVQAEWARAGWRLAVLVSEARSVPEGISLMDQPMTIQERLADRYPDRPEYRSDLARSDNNLGIMHRRNNQDDLAGKDWERALALRDQLVRQRPGDLLYRRDLAQTRLNLGNWYRDQDQPERAEESYRRALTILEGLVREAPDAARPRTDLPVTHFALDPSRIRYDLASTYFNLAVLHRLIRRPAQAAEEIQQALGHLGRLAREQPGRTVYRLLVAKAHYELGLLLEADGRIARAAECWLRSREMLETLAREHPENWNYRYMLALNLRCLSLAADATGRPAEADAGRRSAREIEERLVREHPEAISYYDDAAKVYLNMPASVMQDGTGTSPLDRQAFAEACAGQALSFLEAAEKAGYFRRPEGVKLLKADKQLEPLRSRARFRQLLARALAAAEPGRK
ncbi:MAG: protein kinase [Isosphaerales bacterium]